MVQWNLANVYGENFLTNISDVIVLVTFGGLTTVFLPKLIKKLEKKLVKRLMLNALTILSDKDSVG
jgi:predicted PurR-regulated permease PerM